MALTFFCSALFRAAFIGLCGCRISPNTTNPIQWQSAYPSQAPTIGLYPHIRTLGMSSSFIGGDPPAPRRSNALRTVLGLEVNPTKSRRAARLHIQYMLQVPHGTVSYIYITPSYTHLSALRIHHVANLAGLPRTVQ
ncbi:hypothetical protein GGX14DRAFT_401667 [Mycena pura]|uniref:Secreted protein n=1 Tax=Mycena pura TaxID=153505 RepID=A0AAD6V775_9AGAR|nr:hypothetical protein GGX14DRAFT_401667 [Mycena pura]